MPTPDSPRPEEGAANEVYCFLDSGRPCTAECAAYEATAPKDQEAAGKPWGHCVLLVNVHRVGKNVVILASSVGRLATHVTDLTRQQPAPPRPV